MVLVRKEFDNMIYDLLFEQADDIINEFIYEGLYESVGADTAAVEKKKETLINKFIEWIKKVWKIACKLWDELVEKVTVYFKTKKYKEGIVIKDTTVLSEVIHGIPSKVYSFMNKNIIKQVKDTDTYNVYMNDATLALADKSVDIKKGTKVSVNILVRHLTNTRNELRKISGKMDKIESEINTTDITDIVLTRAKNVLNIFVKYLKHINVSATKFIFHGVSFGDTEYAKDILQRK